jgi:CubicO group peptidase (beta-lactamase class C family)
MRPAALLASLALVSCTAAPPPPPEWKTAVDAIVEPFLRSGKHVGIVVGILKDGRSQVVGYGRLCHEKDALPGGKTLFEIGSITKVFTSSLLAEMAARGEVSLDDPVKKYLSADVKVPSRNGKEITLAQLASHVSGLRRLPGNLYSAAKDLSNPYAKYTAVHLHDFLSRHELVRDPGEKYEYSNLGAGLLGHALARRLGMSYEEAVLSRICRPLGLKDTTLTLSGGQKARLAPGHGADGKVSPNWDFDVLAPAGALRSTADDMLTFLAANLGLTSSGLEQSLATAHAPRFKAPDSVEVGLGWHRSPLPGTGHDAVWHNGATGAYHAIAGFVPEKRAAVVVLANVALSEFSADGIGMMALAMLAK